MKTHGGCGCKIHMQAYTATALGRRGWPPLRPGKSTQYSFLKEAEWIAGPVWTRRSEEKSPLLRHLGPNPCRPPRSQAPCRLSYLALVKSILKIIIHVLKLLHKNFECFTSKPNALGTF